LGFGVNQARKNKKGKHFCSIYIRRTEEKGAGEKNESQTTEDEGGKREPQNFWWVQEEKG